LKQHNVIKASNISKHYDQAGEHISILNNVSLTVECAQKIAIVGASGSGKSTLLNILGGLDQPDAGSVEINGQDFFNLNPKQRGVLRNRHLGFVYQFHHLLPEFSAIENIAIPLMIAGENFSQAIDNSKSLIDRVGLSHRADHKPNKLSGGERQRVAIARALICQPSCVLMDEPTGNLDIHNASSILNLIGELCDQFNTSFIVVTHDLELANKMDIVMNLNEGKLVSNEI
jgi:lipoprotein-releasing system ATP-binding protein